MRGSTESDSINFNIQTAIKNLNQKSTMDDGDDNTLVNIEDNSPASSK